MGDIVVGSVLGPSSQRANEARIAMFLAGFPETVPVRTVNRRANPPLLRLFTLSKAGHCPLTPTDSQRLSTLKDCADAIARIRRSTRCR